MAGRVGRPGLPSNVHQLRGSQPDKPRAAFLEEFQPDVELPEAPSWVKSAALREYERLGLELERYGLISKVDRNALVAVATTWGRIEFFEKLIADMNKADAEHRSAGYFCTTKTGFRQMTAEYCALRSELSSYFKFCAEFGLTPAARSKVQPSNSQLNLPGVEPAPDHGAALPQPAKPTLRSFL